MLIRVWDGETRALSRSGNCAPTSLTLRGAQMDLGPPVPLHVTTGKCRTVQQPTSYENAKRAERLV